MIGAGEDGKEWNAMESLTQVKPTISVDLSGRIFPEVMSAHL